MGQMLNGDASSAYRTESDRELCRELDALEARTQKGEVLPPADSRPCRDGARCPYS